MINLKQGLHNLRKDLLDNGYEIETERWQGGTDHPGFLEILHADMQAQMYDSQSTASEELNASQPWADIHFQERVGGEPLNPPPSHSMWLKDTDNILWMKLFHIAIQKECGKIQNKWVLDLILQI